MDEVRGEKKENIFQLLQDGRITPKTIFNHLREKRENFWRRVIFGEKWYFWSFQSRGTKKPELLALQIVLKLGRWEERRSKIFQKSKA